MPPSAKCGLKRWSQAAAEAFLRQLRPYALSSIDAIPEVKIVDIRVRSQA